MQEDEFNYTHFLNDLGLVSYSQFFSMTLPIFHPFLNHNHIHDLELPALNFSKRLKSYCIFFYTFILFRYIELVTYILALC